MKIAQKMRMMINMKHEYLRELFSEEQRPFPYSEEDYHDFDARDTFSMSDTLVAWLYECLRYFQDEASKIVDFTFHKFIIDDDELTHEQCIDRMVEDCKIILLYNDNISLSIVLVLSKDFFSIGQLSFGISFSKAL